MRAEYSLRESMRYPIALDEMKPFQHCSVSPLDQCTLPHVVASQSRGSSRSGYQDESMSLTQSQCYAMHFRMSTPILYTPVNIPSSVPSP